MDLSFRKNEEFPCYNFLQKHVDIISDSIHQDKELNTKTDRKQKNEKLLLCEYQMCRIIVENDVKRYDDFRKPQYSV